MHELCWARGLDSINGPFIRTLEGLSVGWIPSLCSYQSAVPVPAFSVSKCHHHVFLKSPITTPNIYTSFRDHIWWRNIPVKHSSWNVEKHRYCDTGHVTAPSLPKLVSWSPPPRLQPHYKCTCFHLAFYATCFGQHGDKTCVLLRTCHWTQVLVLFVRWARLLVGARTCHVTRIVVINWVVHQMYMPLRTGHQVRISMATGIPTPQFDSP